MLVQAKPPCRLALPRATCSSDWAGQEERGPVTSPASSEHKATWSVHEVAVAQARDVYSLQEENHAGEVGLLHLRWLKGPHVFAGKFLRVQTEEFPWKKPRRVVLTSLGPLRTGIYSSFRDRGAT